MGASSVAKATKPAPEPILAWRKPYKGVDAGVIGYTLLT